MTETLHEATRQEEFTELHITEAPAVYGPRIFKCIVWDLDNTLWDGKLATDGPLGIRLRRWVVEVIETTDRRGIFHSIASRNNYADAMAVLRAHSLEEFFVFPQINREAKIDCIRKIAQRLRIEVGALAYVGDQEFERTKLQSALPGITVIAATECMSIPQRPECMVPRTAASERLRRAFRERTREGFGPSVLDLDGRPAMRARRPKIIHAKADL